MRITMTLESQGTRPMPGTDDPLLNAYSVTLTDSETGRSFTLPFYTGLGWTTDPSIGDVLYCVASDLSTSDVEDAEDLGLSIRVWEAVKAQNEEARSFFGDDLSDALPAMAEKLESFAGTSAVLTIPRS